MSSLEGRHSQTPYHQIGSGLLTGPMPKPPPMGYQPNPALANVGCPSASVDEVHPPVNSLWKPYPSAVWVGAMTPRNIIAVPKCSPPPTSGGSAVRIAGSNRPMSARTCGPVAHTQPLRSLPPTEPEHRE